MGIAGGDVTTTDDLISFDADERWPLWSIGERRLCYAMLERALYDLESAMKELRDGAMEWVTSDADEDTPMSFAWVAEWLELEPVALRAGILKMQTEQRRYRAKHGSSADDN